MTEMTHRRLWEAVRRRDPVADGERGQLRFFDLANHWTVLAIETQDLGRIEADGRVRYLGRLAGAPVRGCSLAAEEAP